MASNSRLIEVIDGSDWDLITNLYRVIDVDDNASALKMYKRELMLPFVSVRSEKTNNRINISVKVCNDWVTYNISFDESHDLNNTTQALYQFIMAMLKPNKIDLEQYSVTEISSYVRTLLAPDNSLSYITKSWYHPKYCRFTMQSEKLADGYAIVNVSLNDSTLRYYTKCFEKDHTHEETIEYVTNMIIEFIMDNSFEN